MKCAFCREENIEGKGGNAGYQHFLLFLQCFEKLSWSHENPGMFSKGLFFTLKFHSIIREQGYVVNTYNAFISGICMMSIYDHCSRLLTLMWLHSEYVWYRYGPSKLLVNR